MSNLDLEIKLVSAVEEMLNLKVTMSRLTDPEENSFDNQDDHVYLDLDTNVHSFSAESVENVRKSLLADNVDIYTAEDNTLSLYFAIPRKYYE